MKNIYQFYADGIDFGQEEMTDAEARKRCAELKLTCEVVDNG